jgi:superfamily II DNA or RNA helicase
VEGNPVSYSSLLSPLFDSGVRSRGAGYFRAGRVRFVDVSPDHIEAEVAGSGGNVYSVDIDWGDDPGDPDMYCTCPYNDDGEFCKHLWATLLTLEDLQVVDEQPSRPSRGSTSRRKRKPPAPPAVWKQRLDLIEGQYRQSRNGSHPWWQRLDGMLREVWYVLEVSSCTARNQTQIRLIQRETRKDGTPGKFKPLKLDHHSAGFVDRQDPTLLDDLHACNQLSDSGGFYGYSAYRGFDADVCEITGHDLHQILPRLCRTGRFVWRLADQPPPNECPPVRWDEGKPWKLRVEVQDAPENSDWLVIGSLHRGDGESRSLDSAVYVDAEGIILFEDGMARFESTEEAEAWLRCLRAGTIRVPQNDQQEFLRRVGTSPVMGGLRLPEGVNVGIVDHECRPRLRILADKDVDNYRQNSNSLYAIVEFLYGDVIFSISDTPLQRTDPESPQLVARRPEEEERFLSQLAEQHIKPATQVQWRRDGAHLQFPRHRLNDIVEALTALGWTIEAEGNRIRRPGSIRLWVTSGIDWFELEGEVDYDGATVSLPRLLAAARRGEKFVRLDDGSQGMLPEEWLKKHGDLAALGEETDETLKFRPSQTMLLDALLAAQPASKADRTFETLARKLKSFEGIQPKSAPQSFQGTLRPYQQEGLSWLHFLREFHLGGCLADDMGLGKTVQVLALLESRRVRRLKKGEQRRPSLVVVPRSLIFNWVNEAARFTPKLRMMNYTGTGRKLLRRQFDDQHVIVTTYGTLRRDAARLKDRHFDYVILDESQAIKNENSASAKACRLLTADHRLAMTGTPVENHLGELWSLFEFLNPGMLGRSSAFKNLTRASNGLDDTTIETLAASLKPYLLRRTKEQVLDDLPDKTEQTLHCQMSKSQRAYYDELRDFYREQLTRRIEEEGLKKSKIQILEALLRLRQAACHPALVDPQRIGESSAKLEALLEQVREVISEGHKALVFSQFTSLLRIVREQLDADQICYEYLDGKTSKRQQCVETFQNDPDCRLFLISLKAGGHGLNLTAADYVFILDPWWNPAVEAQAVDRAHRIGQQRHVFAYRLICRDTVEERILELQQKKRKLADAIITADSSLVGSLSAEDLKLLLS